MPKWFRVSTLCILLASITSAAAAQPLQVRLEPVPDLQLVLELELNGAGGVWFPMATARQMQADVEAYRKTDALIESLELQLEVRAERIAALKENVVLSKGIAEVAKGVVEEAVRGRRQAEEDRDSVFAGQPGLWAAVGAAVTVALVAVLK